MPDLSPEAQKFREALYRVFGFGRDDIDLVAAIFDQYTSEMRTQVKYVLERNANNVAAQDLQLTEMSVRLEEAQATVRLLESEVESVLPILDKYESTQQALGVARERIKDLEAERDEARREYSMSLAAQDADALLLEQANCNIKDLEFAAECDLRDPAHVNCRNEAAGLKDAHAATIFALGVKDARVKELEAEAEGLREWAIAAIGCSNAWGKRAASAEEQVDRLKTVLKSLANEVSAMLLYADEMRQAAGNTNVNCLQFKLVEAREALSPAEQEPPNPALCEARINWGTDGYVTEWGKCSNPKPCLVHGAEGRE